MLLTWKLLVIFSFILRNLGVILCLTSIYNERFYKKSVMMNEMVTYC